MALDKYIEKRYKNITTSLIEITEDKLELILQKDLKKLQNGLGLSGSIGILISLLIAILTTDQYKTFLGIKGEVWSVLFCIALILSILYTIYRICLYFKNKIEIKDIITHIKENVEP